MRLGDPLTWDMRSGEWSPAAKLTDADVELIRALRAEYLRLKAEERDTVERAKDLGRQAKAITLECIAEKFGVRAATISRICAGTARVVK